MAMSVSDPGRTRSDREAFPSCEICGAVVRRQLMRLHHAWHDDVVYSPTRRLGKDAATTDPDAANTEDISGRSDGDH